MRKTLPTVAFAAAIFCTSLLPCMSQENLVPYGRTSGYLLAPPDDFEAGLHGAINPAILTYMVSPDLLLLLSSAPDFLSFDQWGLFWALPGFSLGIIGTQDDAGNWTHRMKTGTAVGNKLFSFGIGYEWPLGSKDAFDPRNSIELGMLFRPTPLFSLSMFSNIAFSGSEDEHVLALGIRPFGDKTLTIFGDFAFNTPRLIEDLLSGTPGVGASFELPMLEGLTVGARFLPKTLEFSIGVRISLGVTGLTTNAHFNPDATFGRLTYTYRMGNEEPGFIPGIVKNGSQYLVLDLSGRIGYQQPNFFDQSPSLYSVLAEIESATRDPSVSGIVLNASTFGAEFEFLWEIREKLKEFKSPGKKVVIFVENLDLSLLYFASVADRIVCDPYASISITGFAAGSSYYKGLLDKAGIGFDEYRLYSYKSAGETYSRTSMSDEEKEQRKAYIEDLYALVKKEVAGSRGISEEEFALLLAKDFIIDAKTALEKKLIDETGRWDAREEIVSAVEGSPVSLVGKEALAQNTLPFETKWGEPPTVAIVYATGVCDMDSGMNIRSLSAEIDDLARNPFVAAVVVRVDSPGGSALASDVLRETIARVRESKPLVVSLGSVAASGGYWIATGGDTIMSAPMSLTGSIGVAGGWIYDKGLKEKLGISTDLVKIGDHADAYFGFALPFVGVVLPDRALDAHERASFENSMRAIYTEFIGKVSTSRNLTQEKTEEIAQGRIWSGTDALDIRLVDGIGGLAEAIRLAKEKAGIADREKIQVTELPRRDLMFLPISLLRMLNIGTGNVLSIDPFIDYIKFRVAHSGKPLAILDLDTAESTYRDAMK